MDQIMQWMEKSTGSLSNVSNHEDTYPICSEGDFRE